MDKDNTLITVSRFAKAARPFLGNISLVKMVESRQYATNTVLSAFQTEKNFMIELAEQLIAVLALNEPLISSIRRYVGFLKLLEKQILIERYWPHLLKLVCLLDECSPTKEGYRTSVNTFTLNLDDEDKVVCLEMVREFYPFWYLSFNANANDDENVQSLKKPLPDVGVDRNPLIAIWNQLDHQRLTKHENELLESYLLGLKQLQYLKETIEVRTKIAKFLLVQLREFAGKNGEIYREAVDLVHSVVSSEDLKVFMFEVCREFYPFWMLEREAVIKLEAVAKLKKEMRV
jgi:hypothetical protein